MGYENYKGKIVTALFTRGDNSYRVRGKYEDIDANCVKFNSCEILGNAGYHGLIFDNVLSATFERSALIGILLSEEKEN